MEEPLAGTMVDMSRLRFVGGGILFEIVHKLYSNFSEGLRLNFGRR